VLDYATRAVWDQGRTNSEKASFESAAGLGIDTVETVLLYHVVPGATIDAAAALKSDDAKLTTAQGGTVTVNVWSGPVISLIDQDSNARNPRVVLSKTDINKATSKSRTASTGSCVPWTCRRWTTDPRRDVT